ncbi:MAG: methyltransferase domain-containing protein [Desulfobacula sp.]|jgi:2-polyprenyl-3-methyl-5-hydroxy-6-metoxy-1,4-benzoquinol methylase|nr:methyltransferase domain-containing protein [Desulfobacula sp.]
MKIIKPYLRSLYSRTMKEVYNLAFQEIAKKINSESLLLDCGAGSGWYFDQISQMCTLRKDQYFGLEWNLHQVKEAVNRGLNVEELDLNKAIPHENDKFDVVIGLSVLEHLLNGCFWIRECQRILKPGGKLIIVTPNISTYFTIALLAVGKMPSTGPHADSNQLINSSGLVSIGAHMEGKDPDVEDDTPVHRHLIVFSYRDLNRFLRAIKFDNVVGKGFGVYPFPNFIQPFFEKIDKYHAHQLFFMATKK